MGFWWNPNPFRVVATWNFGNVSRWNFGKRGRRFPVDYSKEYLANYPWRLIKIFKGLIGEKFVLFTVLFTGTVHLWFWQSMQEESMWNSIRLSKELIQKFMDESRWIFGEKEKDFLVATQRKFSNNKRINPKRFRHLDGRSRLHQGFLCFSYK